MASRKEQREEARRQREEREAAALATQRRKRRLWQVGATLVVAIAIIAIAIAVSSSGSGNKSGKPTPGQTAKTNDLFTGIAQSDITLGNPQAKVTMYEFADLQCPFCKEYTLSVFPQIVQKYVKSGKVKIVWRNLTFIGPDSVTAARAAGAAGLQNKLWNFVDTFYQQQQTENTGYVTDQFLTNVATAAGVDPNKMKADESSPVIEQQLGEAQNQAQQFSINSTPSFLLQVNNGKPQKLNYQQFQLSDFSKPIDAALKQAGQG